MKRINQQQWDRKTHYKTFKEALKPQFSICTKLDVTCLLDRDDNFFNAFLFSIMEASNKVSEFKLRIIDDEVYSFDTLDINFNLLAKNDCFVSRRVGYSKDFKSFSDEINSVKMNIPDQGELVIGENEGSNVVITSLFLGPTLRV